MTFLHRCQSLRVAMKNVRSAKQDAEIIELLEDEIRDPIHDWIEEIAQLKTTASLLQKAKALSSADEMLLASIAADVSKAAQQFEKNPADFRHLDSTTKFIQKVKKAIREVRESLNADWQTFLDRQTPPDLAGLKQSRIPEDRDSLKRIAELANRNQDAGKWGLPKSEAEISQVIERGREMNQLRDSLRSNQFPPEMTAFLNRCDRGVPLEELTPEILAWLKENEQTQHLKIVMED